MLARGVQYQYFECFYCKQVARKSVSRCSLMNRSQEHTDIIEVTRLSRRKVDIYSVPWSSISLHLRHSLASVC